MGLCASHHALQPPMLTDPFRNLGAGSVVAVERKRDVLVKLRPICQQLCSESIEHRDRQAARILFRLDHQWGHGADQHGHGNAFCAMPANVTGNFSAAG